MAWNCKFNSHTGAYQKVREEVKSALGDKFNGDLYKGIADTYVNQGNSINTLTKEYVLQHWPQESAPQEKISQLIEEETATIDTSSNVIVEYPGLWSRAEVAKPENQDKLFIFTDNTDRTSGREIVSPESKYYKRYGKDAAGNNRTLKYPEHATSAVLRGLDNAMPISTQRWYHGKFKREKGRWTNADVEEFKKVVHQEVDDIIDEWNTGNYTTIVLPKGGLLTETKITGLNDAERSDIKQALEDELKRLYEAVGMSYRKEIAQMPQTEEQKALESKKAARKEARQATIKANRWAKYAPAEEALEVSSAGDEFGRQFSAFAAVLKEGTKIPIVRGGKRKGKKYTKSETFIFDVGGYSIEAAYQLIKGYGNNPKGSLINKEGRVIVKVNGKDKEPISEALKVEMDRGNAAEREAAEEFSYNTAYLPLWREWASQNPELMAELKKRAKSKILTDKYAKPRVSQARALAEIIFGTPKNPISERLQTRYNIQRENAIRATQAINRTVKSIGKQEGVKLLSRKDNSDKHIANLINNVNDKGQSTTDNKYILSFTLSDDVMTSDMGFFINPFEDEKDAQKAVNNFIQWIIPDAFDSLPNNLRVERERRNSIRKYLAKGGYKNKTIITDGSEKNAIYAKTLRYIIDNFEELRQRYNPENIQDFGLARHDVRVDVSSTGAVTDSVTMKFAPNELAADEVQLDNSNAFILEGQKGRQLFVLSFPANFDSLSRQQKDRLFKTLAMAVPEGCSVTLDDSVVDSSKIDFFNKMTDRGFTKDGKKDAVTTNGSTVDVGVYKRNGYIGQRVVREGNYSIKNVENNMKPKHTYIIEATLAERQTKNPDILVIPVSFDADKRSASYFKDSDFATFQAAVDLAIEAAKKKIDEGYTIVLPKTNIGSGWMKRYTPRLYNYLQEQLIELTDYGNREAMTNQYLTSSVSTVDAIDNPRSEDINLNPDVLQSPRARVRKIFSDNEIHDFAKLFARKFDESIVWCTNTKVIPELEARLSKEKKTKEINKLKRDLEKAKDPKRQQIFTITYIGMQGIFNHMKDLLTVISTDGMLADEHRHKYIDAQEPGIFEMLFQYAIPLIEDSTGIRINMTQMKVEENESDANKNDKAEDVEGENTPEMTWQYQHRLVDPYKSLSKDIRKIISSIPMRDPNDLRKKQTDSIGQTKYWNAEYIYYSIMSRMAKMTLGEINNFMVIKPRNELNERQKSIYPLGMPVFPVLEGMKLQYPWANDLIQMLTKSYNKNGVKGSVKLTTSAQEVLESPVLIANIGGIASQFYANFCQQFIPYCTMVDNNIYEENKPTGSASLKQMAINNYQGNIRFKGVPMMYDNNGNVDKEGIDGVLDNAKTFQKKISDKAFWNAVETLKKEHADGSYIDMYAVAPAIIKDALKYGVDALKGCGMTISDYELFLAALRPQRMYSGIGEIASELIAALESTRQLPDGEHIFESSFSLSNAKGYAGKSYDKVSVYWNHFFRKFGDYVTAQEYEANFRVLGKNRYSYVYPSFMSNAMLNLTNPDPQIRRKYIEENFMPYDWFYDKENKKFRIPMLEQLYHEADVITNTEGTTNGLYGNGHDIICKKDGGKEKEYQDWSPQDIYEIMFKELSFPGNQESGNFIIPVLSDSRVCKVIQAPKYNKSTSLAAMTAIVKQELTRMQMVQNRGIIFRMQDIEERMKLEKENKGNKKFQVSAFDKKYFDDNQEFYQKYKTTHPEKLQEVENFDKNGSKFCFYPELNDYTISIGKAVFDKNEFMQKVILLLSNDMNNPSRDRVSFKKALSALQNMSEDKFKARAEALGLTVFYAWESDNIAHTMTKEDVIDQFISLVLEDIIDKKVLDFFYDNKPYDKYSGKINEALLNALLKNNSDLAAEYAKIPTASENRPLSPEEEVERNKILSRILDKVKDFYYGHTAIMSQFLELMVTDLAYYVDPSTFGGSVDFAKRFKQVYGAGMKLNTNSKFGKRYERYIILKDKARRSSSYDVLGSVLDKAVSDGRIAKEEKDAILYKMRHIKATDGQAFRSLTAWRDIMDMIGRNSEELSSAIDNLRNGRWVMNDFYTVFNTLKPFYYGPEEQDSGIDDIKMRTMVQHKNSEAVLLAIYDTLVGSAQGDPNYSHTLRGINRAMEKIMLKDENGEQMKYANGEPMKAIDVAQYHSAVKVGAHGIIDINYSRDKLNDVLKSKTIPTINSEAIEKRLQSFLEDNPTASYYDIEKQIARLLDSGKISFKEYEDAMDYFEPTEEEIFDIIKESIYKNGDETLGYDDQVLHKVPYANYCIQQPTDDHYTDENKATFGSQPRHIIMADLPDDFHITINGKSYNRDQLRERYNGLLVANLIQCYEEQIEPLFEDKGSKGKTKKSAAARLRERLLPIIDANPKYGKQMRDALELVDDGNGGQTFALPMNNITITHQLEEIFTSMFKNAIHRQEIAGGNVVITADVGYSDKLKIRGKRDENGKLTEIEGIECLLPAHSREMFEPYMVPRKDKDGKTYYILDPQKLKEAGLDKLIGYRIPTEGPYSIMPLIVTGFLPQQSGSSIVVAQEIVELTGSDNDIDKLFLMIKTPDPNTGNAIESDPDVHPLKLSKLQRDNELVDIFFGVITHPQMSHLWAHPGNFDTLTLEAKSLQIMKSKDLREKFINRAGIFDTRKINSTTGVGEGLSKEEQLTITFTADLSQKQLNELYRRVMLIPEDEELKEDKTMLDIVEDFTDKFAKPLSPVYPDTFITMHQTYMAGVAEKGIFANNTLDHAKLQWADVEILPTHTFTFNGVYVDRLDKRYVTVKKGGVSYPHYISSDCAECSAAAVDNGKKPVLDKLNCTKMTATFFGLLLRTGIGIKGASLLLAQPAVDRSIRNTGGIDKSIIEKDLRTIEKKLFSSDGLSYDPQDEAFSWKNHNFTNQELTMNVLNGNLYDLTNKPNGDDILRLTSLYNTYNLILNLLDINDAMKEPRNVIHYDSPAHAADTSIGGVIEQTKAVEILNDRESQAEFERCLSGEDTLLISNIEKKTKSTAPKSMKMSEMSEEDKEQMTSKYKLYNALMGSKMPITQAFYTLGIEKIREELAPYFAFSRPELQSLTDRLWKHMAKMGIYRSEDRRKIITQMYKDWVVYSLSKTSLFGDDANMTFDQKRQYYLYDFPKNFLGIKGEVTEVNMIDAIRRMSVRNGMIIMDRGGKTTVTLRDFITDSFDELIQSSNPVLQDLAKKLFMYTYYLNGFDFSYMSFGNMFGTEFQRAFPEYINALNELNTEDIDESDLDNFFAQFLIKRNNMGLVPSTTFSRESIKQEGLQRDIYNTEKKIEEYGSLAEVPEYVVYTTVSGRETTYNLMQLSTELSKLYGTVIYLPVKTNTTLHFNANQQLDGLLNVIYDQKKINENNAIGSKKKNYYSVGYDAYQSSQPQRAALEEKDANVPEVTDDLGKSASAAIAVSEDGEMDDASMAKAVGTAAADEVETKFDDFDAVMKNPKTATAVHREPNVDTDIEEAQKEIEKNNKGKGLCVEVSV